MVTVSPTWASGTPVTSIMNWSMHTRPMMGQRCPRTSTWPRLLRSRFTPSAYPAHTVATLVPGWAT